MRFLAILCFLAFPFSALAETSPRQIVVSGTGVVSAEPDMAEIYLGVSREGRTATAAMDATNDAAANVLQTVRQAGIDDRDVQTSSINLSPVWDQSNARPRQIRGYVASNNLTVRVRDLDALGGLLDAVVGEGANNLNGLSFRIADTTELEAEARAAAVRAAKTKAETLAAAAEVTLGPLLRIGEGIGTVDPGPIMRGAMMEASAPIATGEVDVRVSVTITYGIE